MAEEEASTIQYMLSQDFDAFEEDCSDAVCRDIDGWKTMQVFIKLMFNCLQVQDTCLVKRLLDVVGVWC